jgi:hypothetical protein
MNLNFNPRFNHPPSMNSSEIILATIPGAHEDQQLEIALCHIAGEASQLELRQQTWGEGIGWFTQSRLRLEPHQVSELRGVLGTSGASSNRRLPQEFSKVSLRTFVPEVVRADSA